MIKVVAPGLFSLIQDEGRWGYQAHGMPVAGAMDRYASRTANLLVGNLRSAALLEITVLGGTFEFSGKCLAAVCGADMDPKLDGKEIPTWSSFPVRERSVLSFGYAASGCRAYLAVRGGFDVPSVLGSRSTYNRARVGGLDGRALKEGDCLHFGTDSWLPVLPTVLPAKFVPRYERAYTLRVMLGPQDDMFTPEGVGTFLESVYTVTNEADRMGYRLEGPRIAHKGSADIISDALPKGAVQVPAHGMPIVMMADRQTTGGYPKIATVIGPDLHLLAQACSRDTVRFKSCPDAEAIAALRCEELRYLEIQRLMEELQSPAWTAC